MFKVSVFTVVFTGFIHSQHAVFFDLFVSLFICTLHDLLFTKVELFCATVTADAKNEDKQDACVVTGKDAAVSSGLQVG